MCGLVVKSSSSTLYLLLMLFFFRSPSSLFSMHFLPDGRALLLVGVFYVVFELRASKYLEMGLLGS